MQESGRQEIVSTVQVGGDKDLMAKGEEDETNKRVFLQSKIQDLVTVRMLGRGGNKKGGDWGNRLECLGARQWCQQHGQKRKEEEASMTEENSSLELSISVGPT